MRRYQDDAMDESQDDHYNYPNARPVAPPLSSSYGVAGAHSSSSTLPRHNSLSDPSRIDRRDSEPPSMSTSSRYLKFDGSVSFSAKSVQSTVSGWFKTTQSFIQTSIRKGRTTAARKWTAPVVVEWFHIIGLSQYANMARQSGLNGKVLLSMDCDTLIHDLQITPRMHQISFRLALEDLRSGAIKDYDTWPWSCDGICEWLKGRGLECLVQRFRESAVHGGVLFRFSKVEFAQELGVPTGAISVLPSYDQVLGAAKSYPSQPVSSAVEDGSPLLLVSLVTAVERARKVGFAPYLETPSLNLPVCDWGLREVYIWLCSCDVENLSQVFEKHAVHGAFLVILTPRVLIDGMGLNKIQASVINTAITELRERSRRENSLILKRLEQLKQHHIVSKAHLYRHNYKKQLEDQTRQRVPHTSRSHAPGHDSRKRISNSRKPRASREGNVDDEHHELVMEGEEEDHSIKNLLEGSIYFAAAAPTPINQDHEAVVEVQQQKKQIVQSSQAGQPVMMTMKSKNASGKLRNHSSGVQEKAVRTPSRTKNTMPMRSEEEDTSVTTEISLFDEASKTPRFRTNSAYQLQQHPSSSDMRSGKFVNLQKNSTPRRRKMDEIESDSDYDIDENAFIDSDDENEYDHNIQQQQPMSKTPKLHSGQQTPRFQAARLREMESKKASSKHDDRYERVPTQHYRKYT